MTGRPVTAQEAIAETLRTHAMVNIHTGGWRCPCGATSFSTGQGAGTHTAAAVVEAVRALPAEQVAELLGMTEELGAKRQVYRRRNDMHNVVTQEDFVGTRQDHRYVTDWEPIPPAVQGQAHTERSE